MAGTGASFGDAKISWRDYDRVGWPGHEPFSTNYDLEKLPLELREDIEDYVVLVGIRAGGLYSKLDNHAQKLILTAAVNDVLAVVNRVRDLDGRSAAHAARALFEHLINLHDVCDSPDNTAERYESHAYVVQDRVANHRVALELLSARARSLETRRLDKLARKARRPLAEALAKYGSGFKRQWAEGTLLDRATRYDLQDGYDGYRILSAVIHGSSGAMAGVTREIDDQVVHRTGPDLDLAATAWVEGLTAFYQIAQKLFDLTDAWEAEEIRDRTGNLLLGWEALRRELARVDRRMWPNHAPMGPVAVVAFYPGGKRRWYYYSPVEQVVVLAEDPHEEPDLSEIETTLADYRPELFNGRPLTAICPEVEVVPRKGQQPVPAESILVPGGHPARQNTKP